MEAAGAKRIDGAVGDSLNGLTDALGAARPSNGSISGTRKAVPSLPVPRHKRRAGWRSALADALRHHRPVPVDVVSARQEPAMPPNATAGEAHHFGMFMMKAVLYGRAKPLIDLAQVNLPAR